MHHLNLLIIFFFIQTTWTLEREITVNIDPRREDCFYQDCLKGDIIEIEYQVIDGGHGDMDITFRVADPTGRILHADYKKTENDYRTETDMDGTYKFCFDNTFSSFNTKTVFFELIIDSRSDGDEARWDNQVQGLKLEAVYDMEVEDIQEVVNNVRVSLTKIRQVQEILKSVEARDRNVAEENYFKVNTFSIVQIFIMLVVGFIQVIMLKSLFDDRSKVHKIWKNLNGFT